MKSPQFSTWSPSGELTKGGSLLAPAGVPKTVRLTSLPLSAGVALGGQAFGDRAGGLVMGGGELSVVREVEGAGDRVAVPVWKRVLDWTLIFLSLPITLPLGLFIAGWILAVSPGSIFFRQKRIGRGGREFQILKFRSMKAGASTVTHEKHLENLIKSDAPMTKLDGAADPRIIPGGRCLRAMGLDELPQLINVLRGEMSLVGPRPSTANEYELFTAEQKARAAVLPGLTGYWQVSGKNKLTFQQMIALDLQYIRKMSIGMDLAIVVATLPAVFLQFMESRCGERLDPTSGGTAEPEADRKSSTDPPARAC